MLGTWYSRRVLARNSQLQSFALLLERSNSSAQVHAYYNQVSDGYCQRPLHYVLEIADEGHGVWWRSNVVADKNIDVDDEPVRSADVMKILWTDYHYAVTYVCEARTDEDTCEDGKEYIDVIARDVDHIQAIVYDKFKQVLRLTSYQLGDLVPSDHTVDCDQHSCTVDSVVSARDVTPSQLYGRWELVASSLPMDVDAGPTSLHIMIGNDGTSRLAMTRHLLTYVQQHVSP